MIYNHRKIRQWNENTTADCLAALNGTTIQAIHQHARKHGLKYIKRSGRRTSDFHLHSETGRQRELKMLVKNFHRGDDSAIPRLLELGILAWRV